MVVHETYGHITGTYKQHMKNTKTCVIVRSESDRTLVIFKDILMKIVYFSQPYHMNKYRTNDKILESSETFIILSWWNS